MKIKPSVLILLGGLSMAACSLGHVGRTKEGNKLSEVSVSIYSLGNARVGAILVDKQGRRCGWDMGGGAREIPGCWDEYGSEEGIPFEPEDTVGTTINNDSVEADQDSLPIYHSFKILGPPYYQLPESGGQGLLLEGGCELRLEPISPGRVTLAIMGSGTPDSGIGWNACRDTTSVMVQSGMPQRWWLSWKTDGNKCFVKLAKLSANESKEHRK